MKGFSQHCSDVNRRRKISQEINNSGSVRINVTVSAFASPLLPWKSSKYYVLPMCLYP
jgi:hypothetical protein